MTDSPRCARCGEAFSYCHSKRGCLFVRNGLLNWEPAKGYIIDVRKFERIFVPSTGARP
jgi:hypothetical protein